MLLCILYLSSLSLLFSQERCKVGCEVDCDGFQVQRVHEGTNVRSFIRVSVCVTTMQIMLFNKTVFEIFTLLPCYHHLEFIFFVSLPLLLNLSLSALDLISFLLLTIHLSLPFSLFSTTFFSFSYPHRQFLLILTNIIFLFRNLGLLIDQWTRKSSQVTHCLIA